MAPDFVLNCNAMFHVPKVQTFGNMKILFPNVSEGIHFGFLCVHVLFIVKF